MTDKCQHEFYDQESGIRWSLYDPEPGNVIAERHDGYRVVWRGDGVTYAVFPPGSLTVYLKLRAGDIFGSLSDAVTALDSQLKPSHPVYMCTCCGRDYPGLETKAQKLCVRGYAYKRLCHDCSRGPVVRTL